MNKRLLYVSSSRNRGEYANTVEEYRKKTPWGHAQILYHLERVGWQIQRLAFHDSWNPFVLARVMERFSPDLIFTNGSTALLPVWVRRWFSKWRGPIVLGWDDFYDVIWDTNFGWLPGRFMQWFEPRIVRGSDYIVTISHHNRKRADGWGKKTWYIPNGCDHPEYDVNACKISVSGDLKLVYCGDQGLYKRTGDIVDAMAHVPAGIKLYMIGTPNPDLQRRASGNVVFLGRLPENDKWAVISQADVVVCTADTDCNAKFHEYLRMKKPILAYDGIPNCLFKNGVNALLTRDYPAAILKLRESPALRAALAANAERDIPVYEWKEISRQYEQAFRDIVALYNGGGLAP
ncbi:MAG: glycosyltransferase [bacterium]